MTGPKNIGWQTFSQGYPWFNEINKYPSSAYSEFMPPLRTGMCPYNGEVYPWVFHDDDVFGWHMLEIEEEYHLKPGLQNICEQIMGHMIQLGKGALPEHLAGHKQRNLANNLFWPSELLSLQGQLKHERYVSLLPVSLSKTKDDKGRVLWTFFGASEQGPEKAFWKSFYESPGKELPESAFMDLMQWIFQNGYGIPVKDRKHLRNLGFRILPAGDAYPFSHWRTDELPSWTRQFLVGDGDDYADISYLLTFRPFGKLPVVVQKKYISGKLNLIPFPGSMMTWGIPEYIKLQETLYNAIQIPMLRLVKRSERPYGIRVPQSGWLHQPRVPGEKAEILEEFIVNTYIRTNRWNRFHRNQDGLLKSTEMDPVVETLFSTKLEVLDLYNKPMARNCQILSEKIELVLDGPRADRAAIGNAALLLMEGGLFRYRFYFPPMQAGLHEVFWQRPLVACLSRKTGQVEISTNMLTGYLTGYSSENPDPAKAVELWPRLYRREPFLLALNGIIPLHDRYLHQTSMNLLALLDTWEFLGKLPLDKDFARRLIRIPKNQSFDDWLNCLPLRSKDPKTGKAIVKAINSILKPENATKKLPETLTFGETANRGYEEAYWNEIKFLSAGEYVNKDNADVVTDKPTLGKARHKRRDLHKLGDYLISRHRESIHAVGMGQIAEVGEMPFRWETDFEFNNFGGWKANQKGLEYERNILVIIPGKNRNKAVIMADHYDTAYMEDVFDSSKARLAAAGADDNHSATATLLLAAPIFLKLAKEGKLKHDIWLLHLTGEEFPSDCLGARDFCQNFVQKTFKMRRPDGSFKDLSAVDITGVLVMDMIAHNRDNYRDVFQVAPGKPLASLRMAYQAHLACLAWNRHAAVWNKSSDRKGCARGKRSADASTIPAKALHLLPQAEIRTWEDPHSTLYNTDGMIFSDTGIPVILFMENYDIHRRGYHDTHDTMENIDLDYGAAVSAISIETIARLAI